MLVAFFGDTHGNLNIMYAMSLAWEKRTGFEIDLIVQVGDFGFWLSENTVDKMTAKHRKRNNDRRTQVGEEQRAICGDYPEYVLGELTAPKKTLVIRGNHEDQGYLMLRERKHQKENPDDYMNRAIEMVPNIYYLPDGHVVDIEGVKFGGLGGNFSYKTFHTWNYWDEHRTLRSKRHGGEQRRLNHFTRDRWEMLSRRKMDVLLLHDAPSGIGVVGASSLKGKMPEDEMTSLIYGSCGSPQLLELIEAIAPKHVYCGHWHQFRKAKFGETHTTVLNLTGNPPTEDCMEVIELCPE